MSGGDDWGWATAPIERRVQVTMTLDEATELRDAIARCRDDDWMPAAESLSDLERVLALAIEKAGS